MSEGPPHIGWWQASDGLWYPPETHPDHLERTGPVEIDRTPPEGVPVAPQYRTGPPPGQPGPPGPPGPPATPGGGTRTAPRTAPPPVPARRSAGGGCLVGVLVVVAIVVAALLGARYVVDRLRAEVPAAVGRAVDGARSGVGDAVGDVVGGPCDFLTQQQAEAVLGDAKVVGLGSVASAARPALDDRILPRAPTCWVAAANGRVARVARLDAGDARARFDAEAAKAKRGPRPYFAAQARGVRDEAFCTTVNTAGAAGVFVRRGDRLVYASVTPDLTHNPGGVDRLADRIAADSCRTARGLARSALGAG